MAARRHGMAGGATGAGPAVRRQAASARPCANLCRRPQRWLDQRSIAGR